MPKYIIPSTIVGVGKGKKRSEVADCIAFEGSGKIQSC